MDVFLDWLEYDLMEDMYYFGVIFIISLISLMPAHALGRYMRGDKSFNFLNCLKIVFISILLSYPFSLITPGLVGWVHFIIFAYLYIKYFGIKYTIGLLIVYFIIFYFLIVSFGCISTQSGVC